MEKYPEYKTSDYLSVTLQYDLAADFWALDEEETQKVFSFIREHGEDGFCEWREKYQGLLNAYMGGKAAGKKAWRQHPEQHGLLAYAKWRHLRDGALVNTLLWRYGYKDSCCAKAAYAPCAEFLDLLRVELAKLNPLPPTAFDAGYEMRFLRDFVSPEQDS